MIDAKEVERKRDVGEQFIGPELFFFSGNGGGGKI